MKIARTRILKTQIKKLKPVLDKADELNKPPYESGFIIIGQVEVPDKMNGISKPWLKVVLLTGSRALETKKFLEKKAGEELGSQDSNPKTHD